MNGWAESANKWLPNCNSPDGIAIIYAMLSISEELGEIKILLEEVIRDGAEVPVIVREND